MTATVEIILGKYKDYIIRDVHEKWHERVRNFMLEMYFKPHRVYNFLNYQSVPDVNRQYLKYVEHILRDECSIIALDVETDTIHAVALVKCMSKNLKSWTCLQYCVDDSLFTDIVELQYRTIYESVAEYPEKVFDSLHLFEYFITDELKNDWEFVQQFFDGIYEIARLMQMPRITFLALTEEEQNESKRQGYRHIGQVIYSIFTLQGNRRPFSLLRHIGESEAGLFEINVGTFMPYTRLKVRHYVEEKPKIKKLKSVST